MLKIVFLIFIIFIVNACSNIDLVANTISNSEKEFALTKEPTQQFWSDILKKLRETKEPKLKAFIEKKPFLVKKQKHSDSPTNYLVDIYHFKINDNIKIDIKPPDSKGSPHIGLLFIDLQRYKNTFCSNAQDEHQNEFYSEEEALKTIDDIACGVYDSGLLLEIQFEYQNFKWVFKKYTIYSSKSDDIVAAIEEKYTSDILPIEHEKSILINKKWKEFFQNL